MPRIPSLQERLQKVRSLVFRNTASQGRNLFLSLRAIYRLRGSGVLGCWNLESDWIDEDDLVEVKPLSNTDTGACWHLANGEYLLQYNETVDMAANELAVLRPLDQLMACGATHPIFCVDELADTMLIPVLVSHPGIRIEQNSRISSATIVSI